MIELGKTQELVIHRINEHGGFLGEADDSKNVVLLPGRQLPQGAGEGDRIQVFVYRDSKDRLIATVHKPAMELGQIARLKVVSVSKIGAFLDWGLEKDLFLPFKEQTGKIRKNDYCVVKLYIDKSDRLCASMKVYDLMEAPSPYKTGDQVKGVIYQLSETLGALVAVDMRYHGLIPLKELFGEHRVGDLVEARVTRVREDGRLNLSIREKAYRQMDLDAEAVYERIGERGGHLPFTDKAAPMVIEKEFGLSKNAFKRAVGRLLKEKKIQITESGIDLLKQ
ncbi:MAG: S1-like domain-containing RNA-binding protein [Lachnospiraceae bacterium]|nr:S1-like domain-containing RNA-binding protein [Lachnospiraceae bacterium]MDY4971158.1 S1-like domain-containing RNA-binding protein [Lachnospiraceae bacterium]